MHRVAPPRPWTIQNYVPTADPNRILSTYAADRIDHPRGGCPFPQGELEEARASRTERSSGLDFRPCGAGNLRCLAPARAAPLGPKRRKGRPFSPPTRPGEKKI